MNGTEADLLSAVADRRARTRTAGDVWTERTFALFGIGMLGITIYGVMRMLAGV